MTKNTLSCFTGQVCLDPYVCRAFFSETNKNAIQLHSDTFGPGLPPEVNFSIILTTDVEENPYMKSLQPQTNQTTMR